MARKIWFQPLTHRRSRRPSRLSCSQDKTLASFIGLDGERFNFGEHVLRWRYRPDAQLRAKAPLYFAALPMVPRTN